MKFARQYNHDLSSGSYPPFWVENAISYSQLKKCLKRVQSELASLGLDVVTLRSLLASVEAQSQAQRAGIGASAHSAPLAGSTRAQPNVDVDLDGDKGESGNEDGVTSVERPVQASYSVPATTTTTTSSSSKTDSGFQYTFSPQTIVPKLMFTVDASTGEPLSAGLARETRELLLQLALARQLEGLSGLGGLREAETGIPGTETLDKDLSAKVGEWKVHERNSEDCEENEEDEEEHVDIDGSQDGNNHNHNHNHSHSNIGDPSNDFETTPDPSAPLSARAVRYVQVPLTSDSEFFSLLSRELSGLAALHASERKRLGEQITAVGSQVSHSTNPDTKRGAAGLLRWRQLLQCYVEAEVFFGMHELRHGVNGSYEAEERWHGFVENARTAGLIGDADLGWTPVEGVSMTIQKKDKKKKNKKKDANGQHLVLGDFGSREAESTVKLFLAVNEELLRCLKFQEINQTAMTKILKKFDKRTALGASNNFSTALPDALVVKNFSQALAAQVASEILSVVPQLDDYMCPICFNVAYRPVRLRCGHLFCIRCIVLLQRQNKDMCAICRDHCVMTADSANLDVGMANFLKRYFPNEVKEKQRETEQAIVSETYGDQKCSVM